MMKRLFLTIAFLSLAACNGGENKPNIEVIQGMMDQISIKSQDWDPKHGDAGQMRLPPEGTVSRGHAPYRFATDPGGADRDPNPHAGDNSPEFLTRGAKYYNIYCTVCHGATGDGNGPIASKMSVKPRNLLAADALAYSDGRIFYSITMGRGVMGAYASQIPDVDNRWAIVNYVRSLQKQAK